MTNERIRDTQQTYAAVHGSWNPDFDALASFDPDFVDTYTRFSAAGWQGGRLEPGVRHLVAIAIAAASTYLHPPRVRDTIARALDDGVGAAAIVEVLECVATVGIHAMNIGVPLLTQVLVERGERAGAAALSKRQEQIKAAFTKDRGYWHAFWDDILEFHPELFDAYTDFSSHPWRTGNLSPKVREFIYIAFDTTASHLYVPGLKLHIENALGYGATADEIVEVMAIASTIGIDGAAEGARTLRVELDRRDQR